MALCSGHERNWISGGHDRSLGRAAANNQADLPEEENCEIYNLGGATLAERGLWDYKTHFGARRIDLEAVECYLGFRWKRELSDAIAWLRQHPRAKTYSDRLTA